MSDDITTLDDFERACVHHDLTYSYSDDHRYWRAGCDSHDRIRKAAEKFNRADVERIWNAVVDTKLVPEARQQFYWRSRVDSMNLILTGDQNNSPQELTDAEVNHLRRLLGWLTCEYNLSEAGQEGIFIGLNAAVAGCASIERAQAVLDNEAARIRRVPEYIRHGIKMLTKAIRDHDAKTRVIDAQTIE